jgi:flagellar hook-basal body complex protein FliE
VGAVGWTSNVSAASGQAKSAPKVNFGQVVRGAIDNVEKDQQASGLAIQDLLAGKTDVLPVVAAVAKADMSFKLLMGIRNKVIDAYKQTMNMQV